MTERDPTDGVRLDKWLWVARFFKTRALAAEAIDKGRVSVDGQVAKAARTLRPGATVTVRQGPLERAVVVAGLSLQRGSATVAGALYAETPASVAARQAAAERRRLAPEPALALEEGRPTKRDRRQLADWNRWSASLDDADPSGS